MDDFAPVIEKITAVVEKAQVNVVFGDPKEVQGRVLIPVGEVTYGFGLGRSALAHTCTCECDDEATCCGDSECTCADASSLQDEDVPPCEEDSGGLGAAAGARVRPLAYIDVGPDGAKVVPIRDEQKIAIAGIALVMWCFGWMGLVLGSLRRR